MSHLFGGQSYERVTYLSGKSRRVVNNRLAWRVGTMLAPPEGHDRCPLWREGLEVKTTILIVDDDRGTREALCEILDDAGYSVLPAENGLLAFESVAKAGVTPTLILLDLAMPVMDGFTFLSRVREHSQLAQVPVIVMSGDSKAPRLRLERPANVLEVLSKPIDVQQMMGLVRKHANRATRSGGILANSDRPKPPESGIPRTAATRGNDISRGHRP